MWKQPAEAVFLLLTQVVSLDGLRLLLRQLTSMIIFYSFFYRFVLCACMFCLHVCLYATCGIKKGVVPHVGAAIHSGSSPRAASTLKHRTISLAPNFLFLIIYLFLLASGFMIASEPCCESIPAFFFILNNY